MTKKHNNMYSLVSSLFTDIMSDLLEKYENKQILHSQIFVYSHIFLIDQTEYQWIKKKLICTKNEEPKNTQNKKQCH